jgi:glutaredoxin-related protein
MSNRPLHAAEKASSAVLEYQQNFHSDVVSAVASAVASDDVVVVGMKQNPHPKRAKKALDEAGVKYTYLEYGSYTSKWKERLAIKMWCGWPTLPMVFVKGELIGGADQTKAALADGSLKKKLES